ncbi:AraC family transcriptional regulator [Paenibacillus psychroresistens]|uniref:AraC family transcriptional regulator n=1 Tax=Paenibacillus psychroresistens TaxID=1778678 RepID=A0A6B8RSI0_9BACL|nr:helix-turn-helix domain-containing protein [Paenibacillus psychroresistens]QGQ98178.1 AraC family transcriptional regulator [Paenibacillus psychroresistens]
MLLRTRGNQKVYRNILMSIILCIVITLLISSTILYISFNAIALKQVYQSDSKSLMETSQTISTITEIVSKLSFQIYRDYSITKLFYYEKPNIYDVTFAMDQLISYRLAMPFIDSIYVYSGISDIFYVSSNNSQSGLQTKTDLGDPSMVGILGHFQDYIPFQPIPRTYIQGTIDQKEISSYSFLCYDAINSNHTLNSAVVVNISESWINRSAGKTYNTSNEFIINSAGLLFSNNESDPIMTDYSTKKYMKKILADSDSSGYIVDLVNRTKSLISYTKPDTLGWRYIRVTPYADITQEIRSMRLKTIYISLAILLIGLFFSFYTSKKLYTPIDKVLNRIRALEIEQRNSLQILRQDFLRNIILGKESYSSKALQGKLNYFGSKINILNSSQLVLIKIDHFSEAVEKYKEEIKLIRYAMMNITTEIGFPYFNVEAIDMGDDQVLLLLTARDNTQVPNEAIFSEMIQGMSSAILDYLKLSVSITISPVKETAEQSILLYKQVMEASFHRLFKGPSSLIFSEQIMNYKVKEYIYPAQKEKHLVECLMTGKSAEAQKIYSEIVSETEDYPYSVVQLAISHLMLTTDSVINTIKKNNALILQPDFDSTILPLNQVESIEEINQQFYGLFDELKRKLEEKRSNKHEDMIKRMNEIIERDYSNPNLCLNSIAEEMDMSPIYISRLYKQQTLIALSDVIQEVRMNKSKNMLKETNLSVADIAEKTGFTSSSYFYRMFKKCNGVTPNDFRKQLI